MNYIHTTLVAAAALIGANSGAFAQQSEAITFTVPIAEPGIPAEPADGLTYGATAAEDDGAATRMINSGVRERVGTATLTQRAAERPIAAEAEDTAPVTPEIEEDPSETEAVAVDPTNAPVAEEPTVEEEVAEGTDVAEPEEVAVADEGPLGDDVETTTDEVASGEVEADHEAAEATAHAEGGDHAESHITDVDFSFEGPFGTFDQHQLQRGLQVFTAVCSSCHGLKQVALRSLADENGPGLPMDQVRAYSALLTDVYIPETDESRAREATDHFPTVSGEGLGPDLSLMAKARAGFHGPYGTGINQFINGIGGPEYIYSILTSYTGEEKLEAGSVFYGNSAFPGGWIQMPPPNAHEMLDEYMDGTPLTLAQTSEDIAAFLMWTAEPKMMARKQAGLVAVLFLVLLSALLYLTNKKLWWPIKHGRK